MIPGTLVAIGLHVPLISAGASGLGSNESICAVPPLVQKTITDFALPNFGPRPSARGRVRRRRRLESEQAGERQAPQADPADPQRPPAASRRRRAARRALTSRLNIGESP